MASNDEHLMFSPWGWGEAWQAILAQQGNAEPQNPPGPANKTLKPKQGWSRRYHVTALAKNLGNLSSSAGDVGALRSQLFKSAGESNPVYHL